MSDPRDVGPIASLLNLVDSTVVAIIVGLGALVGAFRWIWNVRSGDLERMRKTESEVALARRDIAALQTDHDEFKERIREFQEAVANKPDREEVFRRLDAIPHQVAMLLDRRRD